MKEYAELKDQIGYLNKEFFSNKDSQRPFLQHKKFDECLDYFIAMSSKSQLEKIKGIWIEFLKEEMGRVMARAENEMCVIKCQLMKDAVTIEIGAK